MSIKILLVDDEKEFTNILAERIRARGLEIDIADNGADAIDFVKKKSFDAVILDLAMPGMDGIETMKLIMQENPDTQVIFLTGHATLEKGIEAMKLGATEFMEKPVDIEQLLDKIKQAKSKKTEIDEKKTEENIKDILKKKGW